MTPSASILVVDADRAQAEDLRRVFEDQSFTVEVRNDLDAAQRAIAERRHDAIVADVLLPGGSGTELLKNEGVTRRKTPVVLTMRDPAVQDVVEAMRAGAVDVIERPVFGGHIAAVVARAIAERASSRAAAAKAAAPSALSRPPIIGRSEALARVLEQLRPVTDAPRATVLIEGESGTGKELIARSLHYDGPRRERPFSAINCATLTENLLEAELFGYEEGAFTGALRSGKKGLFEATTGGTVFLDEIGELDPGLQAKLLRVLQEGAFKRVGGVADVRVDVRIIAATNRDLAREVQEGRFRADLFYRLSVVPVRMPALRERAGDIPVLAEHFIRTFAADLGKSIEGLAPAALEELCGHDWPGNVRELRNVCEYAAIVCDGDLVEKRHLTVRSEARPDRARTPADALPIADRSLKGVESELIRMVLGETRFNVTRAAGILGINRSTLYSKMRDYGLQRDDGARMLQTV